MIEVQPDLPMMRGGSSTAMVNMEFHHQDDKITEESKRDVATKFACFLVDNLSVDIERYVNGR